MKIIKTKTEATNISVSIPEIFDGLIFYARNAQYQRLAEGKEIDPKTEKIILKLKKLNEKYRLKNRKNDS